MDVSKASTIMMRKPRCIGCNILYFVDSGLQEGQECLAVHLDR